MTLENRPPYNFYSQRIIMKKSFILYVDSLEILDDLTIEQRGLLFYGIYQYHNGQEPNLSGEVKIVFKMLLKQFIRDADKWDSIREKRAIAGAKGGKQTQANQANATNCKQTQANQAVTVNGTVTGTVTGTVNGNVMNSPPPSFKSYMSVLEYLKDRGKENLNIEVSFEDITVKVSEYGKAYNSKSLNDLERNQETRFLTHLKNNIKELKCM